MKRIVRLTESDLAKIVKRVIREQEEPKGDLVGKTVNLYRTKDERQKDFAYKVKIDDVKSGDNLVKIIPDNLVEITLKCTDSSGTLMMGVKPFFNRSFYSAIKSQYCKTMRDKKGDIKQVPNADFASTGGNMGGMA